MIGSSPNHPASCSNLGTSTILPPADPVVVQLLQGADVCCWNLREIGKFDVRSMYRALIHHDVQADNNKKMWKMEIHLKLKIFGWYLHKELIFTKDDLATRNWQEERNVCFVIMMRK